MTEAAEPVPCEHHWISIHQPDLPVYWIRQCSQCGRFDSKDMEEQIAKAGYSKFGHEKGRVYSDSESYVTPWGHWKWRFIT